MSIRLGDPRGSTAGASFPALGRPRASGPAIERYGIRPARLRVGLIVVALVLAAGPFAACGNDDGAPAQGPLAKGLSYMPKDAGLVLVAPTDLDAGPLKRLDELGSRFPGWDRLKRDLESRIARDADFERDLRPQLGKPLVFALGRNADDQYFALEVEDPVAMRRLLERSVARGKRERLDDYKGALITRDRNTDRDGRRGRGKLAVTALHDGVLLATGSEELARAAVDRSVGSDNLAGEDSVTSALRRLGEDALFRVAGDAQRLLDSAPTSDAAAARRLPWVRALGAFTARGVVEDDRVDIEAQIATDRVRLRERDLPLAAGAERPLVHAPDAAAIVALREPDRLVRFVEALVEATNPTGFARYRTGVDQLRDLGVDLHRDLLGRIENLSIAIESGLTTTFEADLAEGSGPRFASALDSAQPFLRETIRDLVGRELTLERTGIGQRRRYAVKQSGLTVASFGVRGDTLVGVIGLGDLPRPTTGRPLEDTEGALVLRGDLARLVRVPLIAQTLPDQAKDILGRLGELKASVRTEPEATTARGNVKVGKRR
jgi:hypothetical protein